MAQRKHSHRLRVLVREQEADGSSSHRRWVEINSGGAAQLAPAGGPAPQRPACCPCYSQAAPGVQTGGLWVVMASVSITSFQEASRELSGARKERKDWRGPRGSRVLTAVPGVGPLGPGALGARA